MLALTAMAASLAGALAWASGETGGHFRDPADGRFDVSNFLDSMYGFMPMLVPITEPAVGPMENLTL